MKIILIKISTTVKIKNNEILKIYEREKLNIDININFAKHLNCEKISIWSKINILIKISTLTKT